VVATNTDYRPAKPVLRIDDQLERSLQPREVLTLPVANGGDDREGGQPGERNRTGLIILETGRTVEEL
jgi:hypothetical protein